MAAYYRAKTGGPGALFADAVREYEEALRIDPDSPPVRRLYDEMRFFQARAVAEAYSRAGKPDRALAEYQKSLGIRPDNPWTWNSVAVCHAAMGHAEETGAALRKAIEVAPLFTVARNNLALYYWKLGDKEAARRELKTSLEQNPYDLEANRVAHVIADER